MTCCAILLQFCTFDLFDSNLVSAQSTVVGFTIRSGGEANDGVPNSLGSAFLRTETFLAQPVGETKLSFVDLIRHIRDQGIGVWVDPEVLREINEDEELTLVKSPTLALSITNAFDAISITYLIMQDGTLKIIHVDDMDEPDQFIIVHYDISPLVEDWMAGEELLVSIQDSVANDSWQDTGTGEGIISLITGRDGKFFLSVNQSYQAQMAVRRSLNDLKRLGGSVASHTRDRSQSAIQAASSIVAMPGDSVQPSRLRYPFPPGGVF